jgi:hypothetical protein
MNLILLALGDIAPTPKPASSEDDFDFLKDILPGPSETTVFAPGQNQDLMDALGAILLEPSVVKASQSKSAAVSTSRKNLMDSLDKGDLSDSSLRLNVKHSKAAVGPAGNTSITSSSTFSFLFPIHPA